MIVDKLYITDIKLVEVLNVPFGQGLVTPWSRSVHKTRDYLVVKLTTNEGITAITMDGDYSLPITAKEFKAKIVPYLKGARVADIHRHTQFLENSGPRFNFVEIGLWDILGKAMGMPLYKLWGGARDKVLAYASTVHFDKTAQERAEDCLAYLERGYRAVKLRLSYDTIAEDIALVAAVRDVVGDRMDILVDANQAGFKPGDERVWSLDRAVETASQLDQLGVKFLEEPLPYVMVEEGIELARRTEIPVAGGEGKKGLRAFWPLVHSGIYDVVQPDPVVSGTPSTLLKILALCEAADRSVVFHHGKSGVGMLTGLHLSASVSHSPYLEYMDDPGFWNPEGFQVGFVRPMPLDADGYVHCPDSPGLGIEWDEDWLRYHGI